MDMTPIFVAMLKPLLWLLPLVVAGGILKSPWFKGWLGERTVRNLIRRRLDPSVYREFSNVTVRDEFGDTTQIDHVYVSPYGVFVIETKHLGHWIFGSRHQKSWTQQVYRQKFPFQNPLRQNHRHVKALAAVLDLPEEAFKSVVVFTGDCIFKTEMPDEVCTCADLIEYLHSIDTPILTGEQVDSICRDLERRRLEPSLRTHREHVDNLRRRHGEVRPVSAALPRNRVDSFVEVAGERLLQAAEDRIRSGGRHRASRAVQAGLGVIVFKVAFGLAGLLLVWWFLTTAVGNATRSLQRPTVVAPPPPVAASEPALATQAPVEAAPVFASAPPQPAVRPPTSEEIAERRRQAEESMRILERNTPEVPLALPGSPAVGPSAHNATN